MYPIRKENNVNLSISELHYNKKFGSFRSEIENQFSVLGSKFNRFNNNTSAMQITEIKYYNLQFRTACVLKNICVMVDRLNIEVQPHHMLWYNEGFEFPKKESKLDQVFMDKVKADKNISEMQQLQLDILNLDISNATDDPNTDTDTDMEEINELNHKKSKFRRLHSVVIEQHK